MGAAGHSRQTRQIFSRMITTAGMALVFAIAVTGCHSANGQNASSSSGDPSDVNAAAAQNTCPAGQVLMSDNSCAPADQDQPAQTAPAQDPAPAQTQPAPQAPPQSYPSQQASAPPPSQPQAGLRADPAAAAIRPVRRLQLRGLRIAEPLRQPDVPAGRLQRRLSAGL